MILLTSLVLPMSPCSISKAALTRKMLVGASGAGVDVGNGVGQQEASDLAVVGLAELDVVIGGAIEAHDLTGPALGVAQVVQPSDNLDLPFGSAAPSSKRALAALTILSSASSSLTRRRATRSGS